MKYTILFLLVFWSPVTNAQPGFLDESFADEGKKVIYTGDECYTVEIQPEANILLGGAGFTSNDTGHMIIRLTTDGLIDESFGNEGFAILKYSEFGVGYITDMKVQSNGKIIAAIILGGPFMLARFEENGTLDSSFGTNGTSKVVYKNPTSVFGIQIQQDGKYLLVGTVTYEGGGISRDVVAFRFTTDGSLDKDFGDNGKVIISQDDATYGYSLALQPDGKIVVAGAAFFDGYQFFLARLNTDGSLDTSFGNQGTIQDFVGEGEEYINSIALQPDGKIIAAGLGQLNAKDLPEIMTAVRYKSDGTRDVSFGKNGIVTVSFGEIESEAKAVLLQPDGKIILTSRTPAICRLKTDGSLDSSFGINGEQTTDLEGSNGENDAILQPDGKIVVAGFSFIDRKYYFNALRYLNDITLPLHFTYFNAAPTHNGGVALNWQTAQENNNNYFAVERSGDSRFSGNTEIARIHSNWQQGTGNQQQNYSYTDNAPLQGTNFYRLKQVDKDGRFSYSQVVSATVANGLTVVLYPNPVRDVLNIKGLNAGMSYELSVVSAKGGVVAKTSINNTSSYKWNLRNLSKGVYYLQAESGTLNAKSKKTTVKFVKE